MSDVIVWPSFLPIPLRAGYEYSPTDRRAKTDMEIGGRYRVLFDTDETTLRCAVRLDRHQLSFFESFESHLLKHGVVWFLMPLMTAGVLQKHRVRFKERPRMSDLRGDLCLVEMTLDVEERSTFDELSTWFLYYFGFEVLFNRLHEVLHIEAPGVTEIYPVFFSDIGETADTFRATLGLIPGVTNYQP